MVELGFRWAAGGRVEWSDVSLMPFGHGDGGGGPTREMLERGFPAQARAAEREAGEGVRAARGRLDVAGEGLRSMYFEERL